MKLTFKDVSTPRLTKLILGIIVVASVFYLVMSGYQTYSYNLSLKWKQRNLKLYKKEGLASLENKKAVFEKQLDEISSYHKKIEGLLSSKPKARMPKEGDPLKFKEELYRVQARLKQDGSAIGFEFPEGLGFAKIEKEIPSAAELPMRVKQLEIIQEIGDLMLKAKVAKITAIELKDAKDIILEKVGEKDKGVADIIYKEFPVKIAFNCKNENLINFLYGLSVSDIPFMIDFINLKAADESSEAKGELSVELTIVAAIFP